MYHEAAKISGERFCVFYPFKNRFFSQPLGPVWVLQKLWLLRKWLFALPKQRGYSSSFQMQEPQFLKWSHNFWKGCSLQITHLEMTICFNQATRLFIIISNAGATIFEMEPQFLKNATPHEKKVSLTPQKSENEVPQKSLSPNPLWHGHFAKNQVQFGIFWPLEPHFWSTPPYRGSPPCAIFPIPDTKKYSTAMC